MTLSGLQVKNLQKALTEAFRTRADLAQMVRFQLNQKLNDLVGEGSLNDIIFELIQWAECGGHIEKVIRGALAENPNNPVLRELIETFSNIDGNEHTANLEDALEGSSQVAREEVGGDKITLGDISRSTVAVGREAKQEINIHNYYNYPPDEINQSGKILAQRHLQLRVHIASFLPCGPECYFVNAVNLSQRDIEITHIWFDCLHHIHVFQRDRPLPKRLKPGESWETWIRVDMLPDWAYQNPYQLARARLSTGNIVESQKNENPPSYGSVPGGPITPV